MNPLHTRTLSARLASAGDGTLVAEGRLFDLRRRAIAAVTTAFQNPGLIHDMTVRLVLDRNELRVSRVEANMASFPFPPGPATSGESCPDQIAGVQRIVGTSLREQFAACLFSEIGGVRGCLHVLVLLRFLATAVEQAVATGGTGATPPAPAGEGPVFARTVVVDALMGEGVSIALRSSLLDAAYGGRGPAGPRVVDVLELQVDAQTELPSMQVLSAAGRRRTWAPATGRNGDWENADVAALVGRRMSRGYGAAVEEVCGPGAPAALRELLLALAPAAMQAMPSVGVELGRPLWPVHGGAAGADFCHMWRRGGPLLATAKEFAAD